MAIEKPEKEYLPEITPEMRRQVYELNREAAVAAAMACVDAAEQERRMLVAGQLEAGLAAVEHAAWSSMAQVVLTGGDAAKMLAGVEEQSRTIAVLRSLLRDRYRQEEAEAQARAAARRGH